MGRTGLMGTGENVLASSASCNSRSKPRISFLAEEPDDDDFDEGGGDLRMETLGTMV